MWWDIEAAKYGFKYVSLASGCKVNSYISKKKLMQANFLAFNQPDVKHVAVNSALPGAGPEANVCQLTCYCKEAGHGCFIPTDFFVSYQLGTLVKTQHGSLSRLTQTSGRRPWPRVCALQGAAGHGRWQPVAWGWRQARTSTAVAGNCKLHSHRIMEALALASPAPAGSHW